MVKFCKTCSVELNESNWVIVKPDCVRNVCKKCRSNSVVKYHRDNSDKRKKYMNAYVRRIGKVKQYPCKMCNTLCYKKHAMAFCSDKCRFMSYVNTTETCWLWTGAKNRTGYGKLCFKDNKHATAHRVSFELFNGPIEEGKLVCHSCDIPACVRPSHLWLGTTQENTQDMINKNRHIKGEKSVNSKITKEDVIAIRKMDIIGITQYKIAEAFNITAGHVNNIIKKRVWKHI